MIELLVAISIIVLLVAITLPVMGRSRAQARFVMCASNMRGQAQAHVAYGTDFRQNKPPFYRKSAFTTEVDYVSPDVKWSSTVVVGQGCLVKLGYLTLKGLLDPSEAMTEDRKRDETGWNTLSRSGSSYAYFWRHPSTMSGPAATHAAIGATYDAMMFERREALVMDLNAEAGHSYAGEYQNRAWANHPQIGRMNIAFLDGSVRTEKNELLLMYYPAGAYEELDWFERAHALRNP